MALMLTDDARLQVAVFDSAAPFLATVSPDTCGCVVVDMHLRGKGGVQVAKEMSARELLLPVIVLTDSGDVALTVRAIKAGAVDVLAKPVSRAVLLASVQAALAECDKRGQEVAANRSATERLAVLTERERDVIALAVRGFSNKEIARDLGISHRTVEIHKAHIMRKTAASSLLDLVRLFEAAK